MSGVARKKSQQLEALIEVLIKTNFIMSFYTENCFRQKNIHMYKAKF